MLSKAEAPREVVAPAVTVEEAETCVLVIHRLETGKGSYGGTEAREGERCCVRRDHLVLRGRSLDGALGLGTGDIIAVEGVMVGLAIAHPPRRREGLADYPVRVVPGGCVAARAEADVEAVLRPFDEAPSQRRR